MRSGSRVVLREIGSGLEVRCPKSHGGCGEEVRFNIQIRRPYRRQVVANVYWNGKWERTEHWHLMCYLNAGKPYGPVPDLKDEELLTQVLAGLSIGVPFSQIVQIPLPTK
jgi:hypothetical protein